MLIFRNIFLFFWQMAYSRNFGLASVRTFILPGPGTMYLLCTPLVGPGNTDELSVPFVCDGHQSHVCNVSMKQKRSLQKQWVVFGDLVGYAPISSELKWTISVLLIRRQGNVATAQPASNCSVSTLSPQFLRAKDTFAILLFSCLFYMLLD